MEFGTILRMYLAALGPAIGQCSFEVGQEVAKHSPRNSRRRKHGSRANLNTLEPGDAPNPLKWLSMTPPGHDPPPSRVQLDLIAANRWQLEDSGVPPAQIYPQPNFVRRATTNFFQLPPRARPHGAHDVRHRHSCLPEGSASLRRNVGGVPRRRTLRQFGFDFVEPCEFGVVLLDRQP